MHHATKVVLDHEIIKKKKIKKGKNMLNYTA